MTDQRDPLTALRGGDLPVAPDPAFAAALRARLEAALRIPDRTGEIEMSGTDTAIAEMRSTTAADESALPRPAALPYLTVADAHAAIDWYVDVFGATLVGAPIVMDDGRIGHAELALAGGVLYLADEYPEIGLAAPAPQHVSVSLMVQVPDTDAALRRARERGAHVQREPYEDHGARSAAVIDPFGHRWMLSGPVTGAATPIQHGDVGYVALWTPDADRAAAFYGHVLGWVYDSQTGRVTNVGQRIGIHPTTERSTLLCCYAVTDLTGARQSIMDAGGEVGAVTDSDIGTVLEAVDSQGNPFAVFEPASGTPRPDLNGGAPGQLSYITHEVADSGRFREFYSGLLFWTFEPGRVEDGWQVDGPHPMTGVAGGSSAPATVPMWTVADIDDAVRRVTAAGGTVLQRPARQPYGLMAECVDDQGSRFYLGEF
ncbi:VOC family protein [Mycolicibacterium sp. F2034L]|uniref:VOC family protein n=1 Tax=Mycolicibacterium sp. F2034L TaxID=2926422 RepID=UPI001FF4B461|nr:VOC family protein [Mycolicibacterium sp. F2034L]MCK0173714.1 VOC family protein [Mycolicibacterium sp. F2034L]